MNWIPTPACSSSPQLPFPEATTAAAATRSRPSPLRTVVTLSGLSAALVESRAALLVVSEFTDQPDVVVGVDLWRATYEFQGEIFLTGQGFTLYFDHALFADLAGPLPPLNSGWDLLLIQPDLGLPDDGFLDGLATMDFPSVSQPFVLEFTWLGSGRPTDQPFETYDLAGGFTVTGGGSTSVIPEAAGTGVVLAAAALGVAIVRRWVARR